MKNEQKKTNQHIKTKNRRGFMHPLSKIAKKFVLFAETASPVIDMGCAYGNVALEAIKAGTKHFIACDMEERHLKELEEETKKLGLGNIETTQGYFPTDFEFKKNSIAAIHASHILEYLDGNELLCGLEKFHQWLKPGGKLFILCYTIFIKELDNPIFKQKYSARKASGAPWPGYLENFDDYIPIENQTTENMDDPFPSALHLYEKSILVDALKKVGFFIEFSDYLDGKKNSATEDTFLDGRELVGVIARK